jgi:hypothetical protein
MGLTCKGVPLFGIVWISVNNTGLCGILPHFEGDILSNLPSFQATSLE